MSPLFRKFRIQLRKFRNLLDAITLRAVYLYCSPERKFFHCPE